MSLITQILALLDKDRQGGFEEPEGFYHAALPLVQQLVAQPEAGHLLGMIENMAIVHKGSPLQELMILVTSWEAGALQDAGKAIPDQEDMRPRLHGQVVPIVGTQIMIFESPLIGGTYTVAPNGTGIFRAFTSMSDAALDCHVLLSSQIVYALRHLQASRDNPVAWYDKSDGSAFVFIGLWAVTVRKCQNGYFGDVAGFPTVRAAADTLEACKEAILAAFLDHLTNETKEEPPCKPE